MAVTESVFIWGAPPVKFGVGAADEVGHDLARLGARRILIVTDPGVGATGAPGRCADAVKAAGLDVVVFDEVHVEPTDESMRRAAEFATEGGFDGYLAIGGGSCIDTAKVADLLATHGGELMDYVNRPVGGGRAVPGPLAPLVAVPTTAGTGAECTPVAVLDVLSQHVKTGISDPALRPVLAVVDPSLTLTMPPAVTASSGLDVLCHALESWTAKPFDAFDRKAPEDRGGYCGANPLSDVWVERTLPLIARSFRRAVHDGADTAARHDMHLAALFAGMGFGNAGVHIPHACAYPIAGRVRGYRPGDGYPGTEPMVPHGQSVALTAPAAFTFTFDSSPERHLRAAALLEPDPPADEPEAERLPGALRRLLRDVGAPNGLAAVGYTQDDVPALVEGALKQQRLLAIAPKDPTGVLPDIFSDSLELW
jgi:alcohol dehydrogenase class IV